ncbi:hypothetical protein NITHO_4860005 [Nitrolancea hollandica Lb]|uniref:Uncharacterized protein n=1 Tax=Nitrolancea hollandica Lb TaxID=1129897 RepID=I4EKX5_9BACT|nr:hypothetical protein NITHO_4860005 [Nitrolancea hollandica Lb]
MPESHQVPRQRPVGRNSMRRAIGMIRVAETFIALVPNHRPVHYLERRLYEPGWHTVLNHGRMPAGRTRVRGSHGCD